MNNGGDIQLANNSIREMAHVKLDELFDSVDGIDDAFGVIEVDVPFKNGYFSRVEVNTRRVYLADGPATGKES